MSAPYALAIDIGTSRTAAAIAHQTPTGDVATGTLPLGRASETAPTAVYVGDAELLFGDAAERRGAGRPERLVREFKRRIGDDVPIVAGDRRFEPEELFALVAEWVVSLATAREGRAPDRVALTVPVAWGAYRTGLVAAAMVRHGWPDVVMLSEPEAAARHYETTHPLAHSHALAVYDLGGGTFDTVVLTRDADGLHVAGTPTGIADLGGADFDDAVLRHTIAAAELSAVELAGSAEGRLVLAGLRRECVEAKESLSFDADVSVHVLTPDGHREVRLPRGEFETLIADDLERTADALEEGIANAGLPVDDVDAILLTGGSSRIPRVAQVLSERFDRPIAIDADPKGIVALGAARAAVPVDAEVLAVDEAEAAAASEDDEVPAFVEPTPRRSWFRRTSPTVVAAGACALLLTGAGLAAAPTLGSGVLAAQSWWNGRAMAIDGPLRDVLTPVAAAIAPVISAPPVATEADAAPEVRTDEADPPSTTTTNPRRSTQTTRTSATTTPTGRTTSATPTADTRSTSTPPASTTPSTTQTAPTTSTPTPTPTPTPEPTTDPGTTGPGTTDPGTTDPGTTDPGTTDPGTTDPGTTDPGTTEPATTESGEPAPAAESAPSPEPVP